MPPRRAVRPPGPAPTIQAPVEEDMPTRAELIEALGNLRIESDKAYAEWQRCRPISKELADRAHQRWVGLHTRMDGLCVGVDLIDRMTAELT